MKEGWEIKDLGSVCHVQRGLTYSGKDTVDISDQVVLRATNIDLGTGKLIFDELKYLREDLKIKPIYTLKKDSLLICFSSGSKSHLGKIALVDDDYPNFYFGGFIGQITPSDKVESKYLFYCLSSESYKDYISNLKDGVNINNLKATDLKAFPIPLLPLPEQQRIVSILDQTFASIDKAKANTEQNLQNTKELFESYLQGVFENGDWELKTFDEVCEIASKLIDPKKPEYQHLIHVGAGNIELMTGQLSDLKTAKEENLISGKFLFDESMVLYSKIRPYLMKVVNCEFEGLCSADIYPLKPFEKLISKDYLYHLLLSKEFTDYAIMGSQRAGMPKVNRKHLFAYRFKLPPLQEQQTIVRQLDALQAETQKLESVYQKKIVDLEELKKSLLQKVFAGEFTSSASISVPDAKVIPLQKVEGISPTDLQAGITALALQKHIEQNQQHSFHHVKAEKIVHLSEYILNIDLNRNPVKDAAGPNDFPHAKKVESRARKAGFYSVYKNGEYYDYKQGNSFNKVIQKAQNSLGEKADALSQIIYILTPMSTQQAEIVATIYAAWNNLLLNGMEFTDEDIVTEARENWHKNKLAIERGKFFNALEWMSKNEMLIPKGNGKVVKQKVSNK